MVITSYILYRTAGLTLLITCSAFGPGFQEIPMLSFMNLVVLLTLVHTTRYNIEYPCFFVAFTMGEWMAYAKVFGTDTGSLLLTAALSAAFVFLVGVFCVIPLRRLPKRYTFFHLPTTISSQNHVDSNRLGGTGTGALFIFPISFTAVWSLITQIFPSGSWGTFAYIGLHQSNSNIRNLATYCGIDGIHFWVAWAASLVFSYLVIPALERVRSVDESDNTTHGHTDHLLIDGYANNAISYQKARTSSSIAGEDDDLRLVVSNSLEEESTEILTSDCPPRYGANSSKRCDTRLSKTDRIVLGHKNSASLPHCFAPPIASFSVITFILFLLPEIRNFTSYGQFYQNNIEVWEHQSIRAVCLVGYGAMATLQDRIEQTKNISQQALFLGPNQFAPQTAQLILWSEESWYVKTPSEEEYLFQQVGQIANASNVTIGLGYRTNILPTQSRYQYRNMFVLINSSGQVILKYQKVHPVPGIEDDIEPGTAVPPIVKEEALGVSLGAAICFDFDFPSFINEIGRGQSSDPLIMLQPGWDWGPIGIVHARMVAQRALENGFTLFRCSSGGVSGVYDAYGNILAEVILGTKFNGTEDSALSYTVRIPVLPRVWTLYTTIGGCFGYICLWLWIGLILLVVVPDAWIDRFNILAFLRSL